MIVYILLLGRRGWGGVAQDLRNLKHLHSVPNHFVCASKAVLPLFANPNFSRLVVQIYIQIFDLIS